MSEERVPDDVRLTSHDIHRLEEYLREVKEPRPLADVIKAMQKFRVEHEDHLRDCACDELRKAGESEVLEDTGRPILRWFVWASFSELGRKDIKNIEYVPKWKITYTLWRIHERMHLELDDRLPDGIFTEQVVVDTDWIIDEIREMFKSEGIGK